MHGERSGLVVIASASIVLSVAGIPGLAQSNAVRWRTGTSDITIGSAPNGVASYVERYTSDAVATPANLSVPSEYQTTVEKMLERSPMFKRQCLRLGAATHLAVVVRMLHPNSPGARARTEIRRADRGRLLARVEINPVGDFTELLAHELEHIIEQLDGIDLAVRADVAHSGVHRCGDGTFETSRAVRVGTLVRAEARGAR